MRFNFNEFLKAGGGEHDKTGMEPWHRDSAKTEDGQTCVGSRSGIMLDTDTDDDTELSFNILFK